MPHKRSPQREEALQLYLKSRGKKSLQCIADELGLSKSTVATWKTRDKWEDVRKSVARKRSQTPDEISQRHFGHYGNTNAKGKRKNTDWLVGNKHAVKNGLYESIKYDSLDDDERSLMDASMEGVDPIAMQIRIIREIEVRERRMMKRIASIQSSMDSDGLIVSRTFVEQKGKGDKSIRIQKERESAMYQIQNIESALTLLQKQKASAVLDLHRLVRDKEIIEMERERLSIQQDRLDIEKRKLSLIDPAQESDTLAEARRILEGIPSAF